MATRMLRSGFVCCVCALSVTLTARGQAAGGAPGEESAPADMVAFSVEASANYDDNRDATSSNKESIVSVYVRPRVDFNFRAAERTEVQAHYAPAYVWRDNPREKDEPNPQNDSELYHQFGLRGEHQFSPRVRLGASEEFEMTDDPDITSGGATVREDASYWLNRVRAWAETVLMPRLGTRIEGSVSNKRYDKSPAKDSGDEDKNNASAAAKYMVGENYNLIGMLGYEDSEYSGVNHGAADITTVAGGVERRFSPEFYSTVEAGYQHASMRDAVDNSSGSPYGLARLVFSPSPATDIEAVGKYSLQSSDWDPYSAQDQTRFSLRIDHALTKRVAVFCEGVYMNGEYDSKTLVEGTETQELEGGDDTLLDGRIGGSYRLSRNLTAAIEYEYEDWDSDIREAYSRNSCMVSLKADL